MKHNLSIVPVALILCLVWLMPSHKVAAATPDPCALYTKADAEALFKEAVSDGVSRKSLVPGRRNLPLHFHQEWFKLQPQAESFG